MSLRTFHPGKLSIYLLLSLTDLVLTYRLLAESGGRIYESNPIANAWLGSYGWFGLIAFKLLAIFIVAIVSAFVSLQHPRKAGYILQFACVTVGFVVAYSCSLMKSPAAEPSEIAEKQQHIDGELTIHQQYETLLFRLRDEVIAERCTLAEAGARLKDTAKAKHPVFVAALRQRFPRLSYDDCLMAQLVEHIFAALETPPSKVKRPALGLAFDHSGRSFPASPPLANVSLASTEVNERIR